MKKLFYILFFIPFFYSCCKEGCTDSDALNYCTSCKCNDKSCNYSIRYEVTGSPGPFDITIENAYGSVNQYAGVGSGWYYEWATKGALPSFMYISAQNQSASGNVDVYIKISGKIKYQGHCQGGYCIASANN